MSIEVPGRLKYRIHQGCLMAFRDGKVLPASLKHRWKVQYVTKVPQDIPMTAEQKVNLAKIQGFLSDASTGA